MRASLSITHLDDGLFHLRSQVGTEAVITRSKAAADSQVQVLELHADETLGESRLPEWKHVLCA